MFKCARFEALAAMFMKIQVFWECLLEFLDPEDGGSKLLRNVVNLSTRCHPRRLESSGLNLFYFLYVRGSRDVHHVCTGTVLLTSNFRLNDRKTVYKCIIQPIKWPAGSAFLYVRKKPTKGGQIVSVLIIVKLVCFIAATKSSYVMASPGCLGNGAMGCVGARRRTK
jgi:hypothetical protein